MAEKVPKLIEEKSGSKKAYTLDSDLEQMSTIPTATSRRRSLYLEFKCANRGCVEKAPKAIGRVIRPAIVLTGQVVGIDPNFVFRQFRRAYSHVHIPVFSEDSSVGLGKAVLPGKYPYRPALAASFTHGPVKVHSGPAKSIIHEIVV